MRIIGGIHKSRRFTVPPNFEARPTTDFAKENIFNVLQNMMDLEDTVALDLFSGTGSISFELISRGCKEVVSIEKNRKHFKFICKVQQELKTDALYPLNGDVFKYLENSRQSFDFIFADPPYTLPEIARIPEIILSKNLLKENGIFVMEHPKTCDFSHLKGFTQHRIYGSVNFSIFVNKE